MLRPALQGASSADHPLDALPKQGDGRGATLSPRIEQNTELLSFFTHALQLSAAE